MASRDQLIKSFVAQQLQGGPPGAQGPRHDTQANPALRPPKGRKRRVMGRTPPVKPGRDARRG